MNMIKGNKLINLAKRNALVRWFPSNKVEMLFFKPGGDTRVYAKNLITNQAHSIHFHNREYFYCKEVDKNELVRLGDLV